MAKLRGVWTVGRKRRDELLSAYIDGELSAAERARVDAKLSADPAWRHELAALRRTVWLVHELPSVPAPRNFILAQPRAQLAGRRELPLRRRTWVAPVLTVATTLVSVLFVVAVAGTTMFSLRRPAAYEPAAERQSLEAPSAPVAPTVVVGKEVEVTLEVEMEVAAPAPTEEAAAEAPAEAALAEAASPVEPTHGVTEEPQELAEELEAAPPAPAADEPAQAEESVSRDAEAGSAEASAEPKSWTESAEEAGDKVEETPMPLAAGGGPAPPPTPAAPMAAGPPPSDTFEPTEALLQGETETATAADQVAPTQGIEAAEPPASLGEAPTAAPAATGRPEPPIAPSPTDFRWLMVQIGIGSTAIALLIATIWAWRARR